MPLRLYMYIIIKKLETLDELQFSKVPYTRKLQAIFVPGKSAETDYTIVPVSSKDNGFYFVKCLDRTLIVIDWFNLS